MLAKPQGFLLNGHTQPDSETKRDLGVTPPPPPLLSFSPSIPIWPSAAFIFFLPVQSECCAAAGIQPAKEGLYHADTTHSTPSAPHLPHPHTHPASAPSCSSSALCLSFPELINARASILQKIHFAVTAVLFVFSGLQDYRLYPGLQIYTGRPVSHWPSKACNLAQLFMVRGEPPLTRPAPLCFHDAGQPQRRPHLCLSPSLHGKHGTFSVSHNPITPLRPHGGAIRAARCTARVAVLSRL